MGTASSIDALWVIMLVLSSIGAIAETKDFNHSVGPDDVSIAKINDFNHSVGPDDVSILSDFNQSVVPEGVRCYYNGPMGFYYFVQQWPASYLDSRTEYCCHPETGNRTDDFFIHGLWPQYEPYNGEDQWPQYCCLDQKFRRVNDICQQIFDAKKISKLNDIDWYWGSWGLSSCSRKNVHQFWKTEWEKHGTCALIHDVRSYFQMTLFLRRKIDLLGALKEAGIHPDGRDYRLSDITKAISYYGTGKRPIVKCNTNYDGKRQLYQLSEVYVCVKRDASTVIDCTNYGNCPSMVVFPPFGKRNE